MDKLKKGEANRQFAKTYMNHKSSRSHSIFRLRVRSSSHCTSGEVITEAVLNFVDLAGSEKLDVHESPRGTPAKTVVLQEGKAKNNRIKETKYINKSLFFLTQVISQLGKGKHESYVPYRNSALTKLLKNSLGGNAKTLLVLCISPGINSLPNSIGTLRFGQNARRISNHVKSNITEINNSEELRRMIRELECKVNQLEVDKIKERNQGEELIAMVTRLMAQKKELLEKLSGIESGAGGALGDEERAVVRQAFDLHQELDQILLKHQSSRKDYTECKVEEINEETFNQGTTMMKENLEELCSIRKQNSSLIFTMRKLRNNLMRKAVSKKNTERILSGLLEEPSLLANFSDYALERIKHRLQTSMRTIDEIVLTRKISKKLQKAMGRATVDINLDSIKEEEDQPNLRKRPPIRGKLLQSSIVSLLKDSDMFQEPSVMVDELLPASIRPKDEQINNELLTEQKREMIEEDTNLLAEEDIAFNLGILTKSSVKEARCQELSKGSVSNFTPPTSSILKERVENSQIRVSPFAVNEEVKCGSVDSSKNVFKILSDREQQKEVGANSTESNKLKFATPSSRGTSMYYFTTKKNEFDFSFDRNIMPVEKHLGSALLNRCIRIDTQKENDPKRG